jgi:alpha-methylacyl-CoA racemase
VSGVLDGVRVVELDGIGPGPFGAMLLSDLGADVIRVDRPPSVDGGSPHSTVLGRGRRSIVLDLKDEGSIEALLALIDRADVLIDPFRPGVAERLGIGPTVCLARNPRLVYARMTGWGQEGPLAPRAGHDINYVALSGALAMMGEPGQPPHPPLNLVGDFGGGGMLLALGVVAALLERERSGEGQVVDVAMLDGVLLLLASIFQLSSDGLWHRERGQNFLDGGAPWYRAYRTADDRYVTVGSLEPQFYRLLFEKLDMDPDEYDQWDRARWPELSHALEQRFAEHPRSYWVDLLGDTDVCFAPVLELDELEHHPQHAARGTTADHHGVRQPVPGPRFSRTPARVQGPPASPGQHTAEILAELGLTPPATPARPAPAP